MASTIDSQVSFDTITDLRAQAGSPNVIAQLNGLNMVNDGNGGTYMWSASSTATDDGFTTIQVTGVTTGRWVRQVNPNTIKGSQILSGTALQTAYTINYPAGVSPLPQIPAMIIVQAYSANAAVLSWVSAVTTTGLTVNFSSVPILGTNNINIYYLIIKQ